MKKWNKEYDDNFNNIFTNKDECIDDEKYNTEQITSKASVWNQTAKSKRQSKNNDVYLILNLCCYKNLKQA